MTTQRCRYFIKLVFLAVITTCLIYYSTGENEVAVEVVKTLALATSSDAVSDLSVSKRKFSPKSGKVSHNLRRILYWNDFYGSKNFGFCCGRGPYLKYNCQCNACFTSKDRNTNISSYDVIVFHGREINKVDVPKIRYYSRIIIWFYMLMDMGFLDPCPPCLIDTFPFIVEDLVII